MIKPSEKFSHFAYYYFYYIRRLKLNDWKNTINDYDSLYDVWHLVWNSKTFFACIMNLPVNLMWKWDLSFLGLEQITTMTCGGKISKSTKFDYNLLFTEYWAEVNNIISLPENWTANLYGKFDDDWHIGFDYRLKSRISKWHCLYWPSDIGKSFIPHMNITKNCSAKIIATTP